MSSSTSSHENVTDVEKGEDRDGDGVSVSSDVIPQAVLDKFPEEIEAIVDEYKAIWAQSDDTDDDAEISDDNPLPELTKDDVLRPKVAIRLESDLDDDNTFSCGRKDSDSLPNRPPRGRSVLVRICMYPIVIILVVVCVSLVLLPFAEVIIGFSNWDRERYCPKEPVAILLVIGGILQLAEGLVEGICRRREGKGFLFLFSCLIRLTVVCWFIWASVIVYRSFGSVNYRLGSPDYCDPLLYRFLFWIITVPLGIAGIGAVVFLIAACGIGCRRICCRC